MSDDTLRIVRQPGNILRTVANMIEQDAAGQLFRATVVATTDNTVRIQRTGHDPDAAEYAVLDNFPYPRVGDEVLMARVGSGWMVVGSVLRSGLTENYLKIETKLTLSPGGSIEDADGSIWDQDGIRLISDTLGTDTLQFLSATLPSTGQVGGAIAATSSQMSLQANLNDPASGTFDNIVNRVIYSAITEQQGISRVGEAQIDAIAFADDDEFVLAQILLHADINPDGSSIDYQLSLGSVASDAGEPDDILNIVINGVTGGGGVGVVSIGNANTVPGANPTGGGILYVVAGALTWRGSAGTVTTIAVA